MLLVVLLAHMEPIKWYMCMIHVLKPGEKSQILLQIVRLIVPQQSNEKSISAAVFLLWIEEILYIKFLENIIR